MKAPHSVLRRCSLVIFTTLLLCLGVAAHAVVGVTSYVITASGSQSPAKSYVFDGWPDCNAATDPVLNSYIRWYVRDVTNTSAFVEKVYISHRPNRAGTWDGVALDDNNGQPVLKVALNRRVASGKTSTYTMTVNKRLTLGALTFRSHWAPDMKSGENIACGNIAVNFNQLRHK